MDIKTEITELKTGFAAFMAEIRQKFSEPQTEQAPQAFGELTLVDGTVVMFEDEAPSVGVALTIKGVDGETPAPDGTHETESGLLITTVDGKIIEIEPKEAEEEVETEAQFASLEQFEALMNANAEMTDRIAKLESAIVGIVGKVEETFSVFEKFANQTPEPVKKPFGFQKVEKETALSNLAGALKSLKN